MRKLKIVSVECAVVEENYMLLIYFTDGEVKRFDMKPYLKYGLFKELKSKEKFDKVYVDAMDEIVWQNGSGIGADTLYIKGEKDDTIKSIIRTNG
ncbi:DUF2442 domain-containing protein [Clostridium estertheticum]|uniref:DUF2442 domain-containing protein n=1 Tax=Clostridium estertheticum TaxID=238834 RepID=UPI0013E999F3|nr:DUF2442 domain-containing protein [Clostridium estertheticum]MBZ9689364.1 DUF2442 domain-containing protein [Clostridium estertheticum]